MSTNKAKIIRVVFTQGTTVTLPAPVGSRSSLDIALYPAITMEYHPIGVRVTAPTMKKAVVVPYAQICSIDESLELPEEKMLDARRPGRPKASENLVSN